MRPLSQNIGRFYVLGLLLPAIAFAAPTASRIPTPVQAPKINPDIEEIPTDSLSAKDLKCHKGTDGKSTCAAQAESFEQAAQASSYMAIYLSQYSDFAKNVVQNPRALKTVQDGVLACLQGTGACGEKEKSFLTAALIQYNLGKEVKSMMLKNNTNQANMASLDPPDRKLILHGKQVGGPSVGRTYNETFKLQPKSFNTSITFRPGAKEQKERGDLGQEFVQDYRKFLDYYTETTRDHEYWHKEYKHPDSAQSGVTSHAVWDLDPNTGAPKLQNDQFVFDQATQSNDKVKKIVKDTKEAVHAPTIVKVKDKPNEALIDPREATAAMKFKEFGLGVPGSATVKDDKGKIHKVYKEEEVAAGIAGDINQRIAKKEQEKKSAEGKTYVNVQLTVEDFDKYLMKIWPETGFKYRIPSSEK